MTDEVKFRIPADFVVARATLTPAELAYGFRHGWLRPEDVVAIALAKLKGGPAINSTEEELALLLPEDMDQVSGLIGKLEKIRNVKDDPAALWLFLCLAWLFENRSALSDPLGYIEAVYADFNYPESIQELVRYMPLPAGKKPGIAGIFDRWEAFIAEQTQYYGRRAQG